MRDMLKVSVIIPVYNVEEYVEECIRSVMAQTYAGPVECLLVDDCGTDNSVAVCERAVAGYDGPVTFKMLHHERNRGLSAARNTALSAATGDYVYFLDSDDYIAPDTLQLLASVAERHKGVNIVQGGWAESWRKAAPANFPEYCDDRQWIRQKWFSVTVTACNKLLNREWMFRHDLFYAEGMIHEDNHWQMMAYPHIDSLAFCDRPMYFYREREQSIMKSSFGDRQHLMMLKIADDLVERHRMTWTVQSTRVAFGALIKVYKEHLSQITDVDTYTVRRDELLRKIVAAADTNWQIRLLGRYVIRRGYVPAGTFSRLVNLLFLTDYLHSKCVTSYR